MINQKKSLMGISCSILQKEIEFLIKEKKITFPVKFLPSELHMNPTSLIKELNHIISSKSNKSYIIIIYGDCSPFMIDLESKKNVARVTGSNCYEILLGKSEYRRLSRDGAYFLTDNWIKTFHRNFINTSSNQQLESLVFFISEMHKKVIYIDTGLSEIDIGLVKKISKNLGLSYEIYSTSLDYLESNINNAVEGISSL